MLDAAEDALDQVALERATPVQASLLRVIRAWRNHRLRAPATNVRNRRIKIVTLVADRCLGADSCSQTVRFGHVVHHTTGGRKAVQLPFPSASAWILALIPPCNLPRAGGLATGHCAIACAPQPRLNSVMQNF